MARRPTNGVKNSDGGTEGDDFPAVISDSGEVNGAGDDAGIPAIDPGTLSGSASSGDSERRKRGRPRGATSTYTKRETKEVSQDLTALLLSLHMMGAALLKTEELGLTEKEAERLAEAVARVNREFGGAVLSPKQMAVVNLVMVGGGIYVPRVIAIKNNHKKKDEAAAAPVPVGGVVIDMAAHGAAAGGVM
jgi:hypothetical protein